ncbi:family 1 glycosyl transferase [Paenibacillus sp. 32O-W]|uniref:glycosyltransferase family 4 protein n=1 Tax=Paenibacillus sp. 32O-W TaxID=1695218 RepID=UPI0007215E73|nr:glycosyltransferase [Paenibacillus sp. 32O-W]ALS29302.1 family 1 glycosyl transferase [Paenibacillus sp. 32O-W]
MKILFTYYIPSGGIETLNRLRCQALRQRGIEAEQLYLWDGAGKQNIRDIPTYFMNDQQQLAGLVHARQYDAIVVTCDHFMLERLRGGGYPGTLIYEAQGLESVEAANSTLEFASMFVRSHAQGVIAPPTSHLMQLFQKYFGDFPRFHIQNMVDTNRFSYVHAPDLNPSEAPILMWVGRLETNKNWRYFLEIGAALAAHVPNLQLWMFEDANISEPGERVHFQATVASLGLGRRLKVFSNMPHDHMPHYFSVTGYSGGMLVSTSKAEGFGYAVAEAMSCRCPVLATDSDGVRHFIDHDVTGKFMTASVHDAVRQALDLMRNAPLRKSVIAQGEARIRTLFTPERYVSDLINVMRALGHPI